MSEENVKSVKNAKSDTPMFIQYRAIKEMHPGCVLFFRLGDFYELFEDDAVEVSRVLDLTLTQRAGKPMCGVPHHAAETYIQRLIALNYKVAICEQVGDVSLATAKNPVEREVIRIITPGTVTDDCMLETNKNNYIASLYRSGDKMGIAYADITTGLFEVEHIASDIENTLTDILTRVAPSEVIANIDAAETYDELPLLRTGTMPKSQRYHDWAYRLERCDSNLKTQLGDNYLNVCELGGKKEAVIAAGALLEYLNETQKRQIKSIKSLKLVRNSEFLQLDTTARRNLEIVDTIRDRKRYGSLIWLMDKTKTSMGARKLRYIFDHPLTDSKKINSRLDKVEELYKKSVLRSGIAESLASVYDIERLAGKVAYGNITPKEVVALARSLQPLPELKRILNTSQTLTQENSQIDEFSDLCALLLRAIKADPPVSLKDGGYIADGFNAELDSLRNIKQTSVSWISKLEAEERLKTGIKSLKIVSNRVYGYFIEVNKKESERVPLYYRRKQTVANNERYVTEDLKMMEEKIFSAAERAVKLEAILYSQLKAHLQTEVDALMAAANAISDIDAYYSLAQTAADRGYVRPEINDSIKEISIEGGRHPVVESFLPGGTFISNDTSLSSPDDNIMIITGPNMAGKSTYMRQVALITLMAHMGSFVPAKSAKIAITDRIFTRVGASDDLAFGQSTFMVEMSEVATILANATEKSLIILDEIGRGTSTFDGLSIAWAVVEHLSQKLPAKVLFATHYHELTELEGNLKGVKNYKIMVKETDSDVIFLRKITRGGANKSFGIEVARMAGLPMTLLNRAKQISKNLESLNHKLDVSLLKEQPEQVKDNQENKKMQEIYRIIQDIDVNRTSPMVAFDILVDLCNKVKE